MHAYFYKDELESTGQIDLDWITSVERNDDPSSDCAGFGDSATIWTDASEYENALRRGRGKCMRAISYTLSLLASAFMLGLSYSTFSAQTFMTNGGFIRCGTPLGSAALFHLVLGVVAAFPLWHFIQRAQFQRAGSVLKVVTLIISVSWIVNAYAFWLMRHWLY